MKDKNKNKNENRYASLRLDDQLCFPLYSIAKEITRQYRKPLKELNLTYTQYVVMMVLWEKGNMTEGELGQIVHLDSGTLAPLLKRMEKQGYIHRIKPDNNERKLTVELTQAGKELKEKALAVPGQMDGCIPLEEEELVTLKDLLDKAMTKMEFVK
ncbi:MAG: MarR family transcriptional regulator [Lachnospiraceae bacterium]|nr:MarR family transcriptional regulator [Lachnospiraceae bacterium]